MTATGWIVAAAAFAVAAVIFFLLGIRYRKRVAEKEISSAEEEATRIINEAIKSSESKKREALLEAKEEILKNRSEYEREVKERRAEQQKQERRLQQKEENLDHKTEMIEKKEEALAQKHAAADKEQEEIQLIKRSQTEMLERISGFTADQAKEYLIAQVESEVTHETALKIKEIEARAKDEADQRAREIVATAIQRCAADHVAEITVSVVPLPNDEMKGRIIGREGRNIRTLETLTGADLIIDDTPSQTKYQRYATLRAIFRSPGQSVPQPIPIISEDTAAHGVEKVIFKKLSHKGENKRGQLTATLELWEYIPQTITAKSGSSSGSSSSSGKSGGGAASNLKADYKSYLSNDRGKSPARDDADTTAAMNKVTAMPY